MAELKKEIKLFDAIMLVAGSMIGSGIFIVSADVARQVGSSGWLLAAWLLAGVLTLIGAVCYTERAGMFPTTGGKFDRVFVRMGIFCGDSNRYYRSGCSSFFKIFWRFIARANQ